MPGSRDMRVAAPGVKLTYDDFVQFPDDGKRHELIDGEHYVTPSPSTRHQKISGNLYWRLRSHLEQTRTGQLFYAPYDIVFSQFDVVDPEIDTIREYRLAEAHYGRARELSREAGDVLTSPLFPGLELPLDGVFTD